MSDRELCAYLGAALDSPTVEQVTQHSCCWCMGAVGATECHAPGHAEASEWFALKAERDRYEKALRQIKNNPWAWPSSQSIARAALDGGA